MKCALITDEQIKAIEDALMVATTLLNKDRQAILQAFLILKSLKVQESVAIIERNSAGQIYLKAPVGDHFDISKYVGMVLYAKEQP